MSRTKSTRQHGSSAEGAEREGAAPVAMDGRGGGALAKLDDFMRASVWHPRVVPFFVYILMLLVLGVVGERWLWAWPVIYTLQCGIVAWLLWRYRGLLPELTLRFHWLALLTGVGLAAAWVALGEASMVVGGWVQGVPYAGAGVAWAMPSLLPLTPEARAEHLLVDMGRSSPTLMWVSLGVKLLGMSLVVPLFEELFVRSAVLRALLSPRRAGLGAVQFLLDMPVVGDALANTRVGQRALNAEPAFAHQFRLTPLGKLSVFGVIASTVVFAASHAPRDWMGCFACGFVWCWLLWYTNRSAAWRDRPLGLGPICWSHGITNAVLWGYTLWANDWTYL